MTIIANLLVCALVLMALAALWILSRVFISWVRGRIANDPAFKENFEKGAAMGMDCQHSSPEEHRPLPPGHRIGPYGEEGDFTGQRLVWHDISDMSNPFTLEEIRKCLRDHSHCKSGSMDTITLPWYVWDNIFAALPEELGHCIYPENGPLADVEDLINNTYTHRHHMCETCYPPDNTDED